MSTHATRRQILRRASSLLAIPLFAMPNTSQSAPALPSELKAVLPQAQRIGCAVLRFFGLRVYEACLWAGADFQPQRYAQQPIALELRYERKLDGSAIAERSIAEMRRIGAFSEEKARQWLDLMTRAFPDVIAQDRLLGWSDGQGEVRFFHNGRLTASIQDAEYARLFFGIWLAPESSAPALRKSLLGLAA